MNNLWVLLPPLGDAQLRDLQTDLFRRGILESLGPDAFLPLGETEPDRRRVQSHLPFQGTSWLLKDGFLGIPVSAGLQDLGSGLPFPSGMILLGRSTTLPGFPCPQVNWQTARGQLWQMDFRYFGDKIERIEIRILETLRFGGGKNFRSKNDFK